MAFWTKLKRGVCCLDPFPFQACPKEKQKKKLSQGVKGFFMSRLFKNCYNWPGILRLRSSINSPWNVIWINVCIRTRSSWHCRYVFREGSLNKHIYPWIHYTEYLLFMVYTFKWQQPFFRLLSVFLDWSFACGFWITDVEIYNLPQHSPLQEKEEKN